jgi:SAM-dependent methyltransferase
MAEQENTQVMDFDQLYQGHSVSMGAEGATLDVIPWRLDGPQPIVIRLADAGEFTGPVLECGCGLGDNALFLAERGYQVTAFDASPTAIDRDRAKAAARELSVDFRVADATVLDGIPSGFTTVLDSAMLHCLTDEQRRDYLAALHEVTEPDTRLHILCFRELASGGFTMPGHTDEASLRRDLSEHWRVDRMDRERYTTGLSLAQWHEQMPPEAAIFQVDLDSADAIDEQGRVLLPIWQITATRA